MWITIFFSRLCSYWEGGRGGQAGVAWWETWEEEEPTRGKESGGGGRREERERKRAPTVAEQGVSPAILSSPFEDKGSQDTGEGGKTDRTVAGEKS